MRNCLDRLQKTLILRQNATTVSKVCLILTIARSGLAVRLCHYTSYFGLVASIIRVPSVDHLCDASRPRISSDKASTLPKRDVRIILLK